MHWIIVIIVIVIILITAILAMWYTKTPIVLASRGSYVRLTQNGVSLPQSALGATWFHYKDHYGLVPIFSNQTAFSIQFDSKGNPYIMSNNNQSPVPIPIFIEPLINL